MSTPLLVVSGTGTEIGKTHVAGALLQTWARALRRAGHEEPQVLGLKPVESGVVGELGPDGALLEQLSTFHVKRFPPPYLLARAVSPHLAAREEGRVVELPRICAYVEDARAAELHGLVVELAGGLFSPLAPELANADVALELDADGLLLVAPDRLGVLHDLGATTRAAAAMGLPVLGIVLVAPSEADLSTGSNAAEVSLVTEVPVLAVVPRGTIAELALREDLAAIVRTFVRAPTTHRRP